MGRKIDRKPPGPIAALDGGDDFLKQTLKLIPSESVLAYVAGHGVLAAADLPAASWTLFAIVLVGTPLYQVSLMRHEGADSFTGQVVLSSLAFVFWAIALGHPFDQFHWYHPAWGSLALLGFGFLAPVIHELLPRRTPSVAVSS